MSITKGERMPLPMIPTPPGLLRIRDAYASQGHGLWFVGGCVRDALKGVPCKDVDLATTATPEQQVAACDAAELRWFGTGLQHGTITVVVDGEPYEITTLRRDVETDGRHAEVEWTTDIEIDLGRRDLTINAMAMTFDGDLVDPFGGRRDLSHGRVRFVGDAAERIREDHLRILRWFRFFGRFGTNCDMHGREGADLRAISDAAHLLERISVERIWSETSKILTGPNTLNTLRLMDMSGTLEAIGLVRGEILRFRAARNQTADPAALLAFWQGGSAPAIMERWKASGAERDAAAFVAARLEAYDAAAAKADLVDGARRDVVMALLAAHHGQPAVADMGDWIVPTFPIKGADLVAAGMKQGREVGERLQAMRTAWAASDYRLDAESLMAIGLREKAA